MEIDALQKARQEYQPLLPLLLKDFLSVGWSQGADMPHEDAKIKTFFPSTSGQPLLIGEKGKKRSPRALRIGVVFSGGPASGGHNVITGIYDSMMQLDPHSKLFGFLDGPEGIISGKNRELTLESLKAYRNQGGFDLIGSGRTKIETEEQLKATLVSAQKMNLDGLVIIGGDDSNTNAAILAEYFVKHGAKARVIGVPKTIDGDLKNAYVAASFGFDTACKIYSEMIGNIARDATSAKKYYHFIKLMGRSASHVALECALVTRPNLTLIGEEVAALKKTLSQIVIEIADLIAKRAESGKKYGVILIPEGLIEFIPEIGILIKELNHICAMGSPRNASEALAKLTLPSQNTFSSLPEKIQQQLLFNRDPHGNVQVSLIETERFLMDLVAKELEIRKMNVYFQNHFLGYEGRAGYPSNFDCNYCYALGFAATLLIHEGATGYMACISNLIRPPEQWGISGVPLTALMHVEMRKGKERPVIQKKLVELEERPFKQFAANREKWKVEDAYRHPGPMQFYGDPLLTEGVPLTLTLES